MTRLTKKICISLAAVITIMLFTASTVNAGSIMHAIKAYSGVKIIYNGQELVDSSKPYIINNTTYVPLRMLINNFGDKEIAWDAANSRVIINNKTTRNEEILIQQVKQKDAEIAALKSSNATLTAQIADLENEPDENDTSISKIKSTLNDYFEDAGSDYFDDDQIELSISLGGDEDDLEYTIKLDFDDADDYDDLQDVSTTDLKEFLDDVKSKINSEIDGTDYEDADITGRLSDYDDSDLYVDYNGSSYDFSWDDEDDITVSEIRSTLYDYFENAGSSYFGDDQIDVTISLSGDEDDLAYTIKLDFDNADDYDDLSDVSTTKLKSFLNAVKSRISSTIDGTDYEDADITGRLSDYNDSDFYVEYNGSTYEFSW